MHTAPARGPSHRLLADREGHREGGGGGTQLINPGRKTTRWGEKGLGLIKKVVAIPQKCARSTGTEHNGRPERNTTVAAEELEAWRNKLRPLSNRPKRGRAEASLHTMDMAPGAPRDGARGGLFANLRATVGCCRPAGGGEGPRPRAPSQERGSSTG